MTQNLVLVIQFLVSFLGVILTIIKIIDLLRFKHIERIYDRLEELEKEIETWKKERNF